ncbi:NERD domain-containing protein (plasmid) [Streptomyces platensis]|uniref:nuclease-related domain-containing protein n=1 Tax=Streptomyces platensis TaxID=58346 RepID=UPI002ECFB6CD|nr:NERD domain-containing protein [Streptomyces platensis]
MTAGASAAAKASIVGRGRLWQRALRAVGVTTPGMAKAQSNAARWQAGAEGERRTARLLTALVREGWHVLYDLAVGRQANVDALLVGPDGQVFTLDTKLWAARDEEGQPRVVHLEGGRLKHGDADRDRQVDTALWETGEVSKALGAPVTPLIVVHNAPVEGGGFHVRGVSVFPADRLLELLRHNASGRQDPREALRLAERAEVRLPPK